MEFKKEYLPFLGQEELRKAINMIIHDEIENVSLRGFYPFLNQETLSEIADMFIEGKIKGDNDVKQMLPFLDRDKLVELYKKTCDGEIDIIEEKCFYPFIPREALAEEFYKHLNEFKKNK